MSIERLIFVFLLCQTTSIKTSSEYIKDKIIIGRKPILDALADGTKLEKVWLDKTIKGELEKDIRNLTKQANVPLQYIPKERLNSLAGKSNHQGLAAQLAIVNYQNLEDVLPHLYEQGKTPAFLMLDGIEDVRNIGALARSAVWFGFHAIIVPQKRTARINSFAYKASAGAIKDIPLCRVPSLQKAMTYLKDSGVHLIVADLGADTSPACDFSEPIALIMGSESNGVTREVSQKADTVISIAGTGNVDSLNVSVAGAILMNEIFKSRIK